MGLQRLAHGRHRDRQPRLDVPEEFVPAADDTTVLSSFYFMFMDLNSILLEFATTKQELGDPDRDLQHAPATAAR